MSTGQCFQLFIEGEHISDWATLSKQIELPDGRIVKTEILPDGRLQYVRRTGAIGISDSEYVEGEPKPWQWRRHPEVQRPVETFEFAREQLQKELLKFGMQLPPNTQPE